MPSNNKEYQRAYNKMYYQKKKEELDAYNKQWALDNPELVKEYNKKRAANQIKRLLATTYPTAKEEEQYYSQTGKAHKSK